MNLYNRIARTHFGSSALFGGCFLAATAGEGLAEALSTGGLAAAAWFAAFPLLKRLTGAAHGA